MKLIVVLKYQFFMKVLLSPAKSINENCQIIGDYTLPIFENDAQKIVRKLKKFKTTEIMNLMSVSAEIAQLNVNRFKNWTKAESSENNQFFQTIRAFSGEVYRGFNTESISLDNLEKVNDTIRILSGLYGYLRPFDLISPYRLEMGTKFSPDLKSKNLYDFWNSKVTNALNKELTLGEEVINLASAEYYKVIVQKKIKSRIITPIFKEFKNGQFSIVMMYAKHARGSMARYIIDQDIKDSEKLKFYNTDKYSFDDKLSTENEWVFVR
jgi:cytoplasmic iron level regulating protein YaaA (DUF328/UPF0246 family)